ncbi:DUF2971 domain-containing protein [Serratia liquefaciens]|uniref:DUF2971 domain-containing protein n=1 Tax=Serratia liquefaciens TaxID=614 RepID=UPI0015A0E43D|nr:DUF2971 domain-containing protein [Serratia liquefaciens]NWA20334.1 DUF2971 domain-containing protein [Serratia liquefaciens]
MALIYHYCSPQTFLQIIERKCIWLSSTNNMNDSTEGQWYINIVKRVLAEDESSLDKEWRNIAMSGFTKTPKPNYIACFSKNEDSLSQWRSYAEDGFGVAIGFEDGDFEGFTLSTIKDAFGGLPTLIDIEIKDVEYKDYDYYKKLIIELAGECINKLHSSEGNDVFSEKMSSAAIFNGMCERAAIAIKNPAFIEEQERRLIFNPDYCALKLQELPSSRKKDLSNAMKEFNGVKHRISNGFLTSHFEFPILASTVKRIMLGPKNKFTDSDLRDFLLLNDMGDVEVKRSLATYR